jgi:hypothetical protein
MPPASSATVMAQWPGRLLLAHGIGADRIKGLPPAFGRGAAGGDPA